VREEKPYYLRKDANFMTQTAVNSCTDTAPNIEFQRIALLTAISFVSRIMAQRTANQQIREKGVKSYNTRQSTKSCKRP
jgi:hypothetical protein